LINISKFDLFQIQALFEDLLWQSNSEEWRFWRTE